MTYYIHIHHQCKCADCYPMTTRVGDKPHNADTPCDYGCCTACFDRANKTNGAPTRMIVCKTCGCKRCPHAEWHGFECTRSNEPGQVGIRSSSAGMTPSEWKWFRP